MKISIVGPAMNEAGNLEEYVDRCLTGIRESNVAGEIIIVDDGSCDGTATVLQGLIDKHPDVVKGYMHRRNFGLTAALKTGFRYASGDYVIWISTDLEAHPDEDIPIFVEAFAAGADVVAGARVGRGDGKDLASKIYNVFCRQLFGLQLRDMNWLKGFRRECLEFLQLRGDWHRFILVMLHTEGFKIVERDMQWHTRRYGESKFGWMRFPRSLIDAVSIWFMLFFSRRPMRLFGAIGGCLLGFGFFIHAALAVIYIISSTQIRPLFWGAIGVELFAIQMIMTGFIGELLERVRDDLESGESRHNREKHRSISLLPGGKIGNY
ncbi:MAG: glycosyltransferase [Halioglobus sp.]|nr:glycosyltransferase [Halioglobus sp.]